MLQVGATGINQTQPKKCRRRVCSGLTRLKTEFSGQRLWTWFCTGCHKYRRLLPWVSIGITGELCSVDLWFAVIERFKLSPHCVYAKCEACMKVSKETFRKEIYRFGAWYIYIVSSELGIKQKLWWINHTVNNSVTNSFLEKLVVAQIVTNCPPLLSLVFHYRVHNNRPWTRSWGQFALTQFHLEYGIIDVAMPSYGTVYDFDVMD
jgi:hypothetical protein